MRLVLLTISLFLFTPRCFAQKLVVYDSSQIELRTFSPATLAAYKADKDFQYERISEPPQSLWDRFWDWFWGKMEALFNSPTGRVALKTVFILLAIAVLSYFIFNLMGISKVGLFGRNTGKGLDYSLTQEDIHTINFEQAIQQAVSDANFRLAVRLLYLQSLKKLADNGFINWQIDKTNIAYVRELLGSKYQAAFSNLTLQFESNWYGEVPIEEAEFAEVREKFNQFNRQLI